MGIEPMDAETRHALEDIIHQANAPLITELERLRLVLIEGDEELEIPSLLKQHKKLERRVGRLEKGAVVLLIVLGTLVAVAVDPRLVESVAHLLRLIGLP